MQTTRLQCKQLENRLQNLQTKIEENGVGVSETHETDLLKIMGGQNLEATPHMKLFWEQQMILLQSKKMGSRYHPQVIRFSLSIHGKSTSAYRELRDSGALVLPSERVLWDYKKYFKSKAGINKDNIETLRKRSVYIYIYIITCIYSASLAMSSYTTRVHSIIVIYIYIYIYTIVLFYYSFPR